VLWRSLAVAVLCSAPALARELLTNPSFERDRDRDGVPDGWHRIWNEKLSGPFALVDDAQQGRRALRLETEEWNFLRPQHVAQEVKLPRGATHCRLGAWAKGRGLVALAVQFRRDGKPLEEKTIDLGFGPQKLPVEAKSEFALGADYALHEAFLEIPKGADGALVKLGNTAGPLDRLNTWGRCLIDNASFVAGSQRDTESQAPGTQEPEPLHAVGELRNVAPFSRIRLEPPAFDASALTDGDIETTAHYYAGAARGGINCFVLPKPLPVKRIRLHLNGVAGAYTIRGDADGDGAFEALLVRTAGLEGLSGWKTHTLPGQPLKALRIQPIYGKGLWGFRQCHPYMTEIEILAPVGAIPDEELKRWARNVPEQRPAGGVPLIEAKPAAFPIERGKSRFRKLVCADLWMWGIHYDQKTKKGTWTKEKVKAGETFQKSARMAKEMGVDTIFIDLTNSTCWDLMPWPSQVCHGTEDNILKCLIDALHDEGFRVVTETLHNFTPFEPIKWHYPCEETSRYPAMKQFPSILYGGHVRDNWLTVYEEQIAAGADGVCLGSDEFYYRGHFLETLPPDDAQRKDYERRFGHPVPAKEADTLEYRQWVAHTQEGLAGLFGHWNAELKKRHPGLTTCSVLMQPVQRSNLYGEGVPFALIGQQSGVDEVGSDYMGPWGIRMLAAANGWRKVSMLFWGWQKPEDPPLQLYAKPLWMLMYGGGSCNYWRFYQLQESGHWKSVKTGFDIAAELEALGAWDARPPRDIAVLSSPRSWDWWQVRAFYGPLERPAADRAIEAMRGWFADELVNDRILLRNGYPYDWRFMDDAKQLEGLDGCKLLLLPFAYSVSDAAAARVADAAAKGAKVVLFGTLGETDEWGRPRETPAFKSLVDSGKATLIADDALEAGGDEAFVDRIVSLIDTTLGERHPFKMTRHGKHVDATLLAKSDREKFVFLINWEEKPAPVDLVVGLPEGTYSVMMRDDAAWHEVALGGKTALPAAALRKFRRLVPALKAEVYVIRPAPAK